MTNPGRFGAVLTAMVTPFDSNGRVDLDVARDLARYLANNGNDGLVVAGTTGESPTLSDQEKLDLFAAISEAVTVPVIGGTGSNDTEHSIALTKAASQTGLAGILAVTPYYNRPSQAGIAAHFTAVAFATKLPVMLYDIPVRSGRKIAHDTLLSLAHEVNNIVAVKDATGNPGISAQVVVDTPDDFELYSGDDAMTLPLLAVGAVGTVGVATHWSGNEHAEMLAAFWKGDIAAARTMNASLLESYDFETGDAAPNPVPAKAMMRTLDLAVGQCRLPMGDAPAGLEDRAHQVYKNLQEK